MPNSKSGTFSAFEFNKAAKNFDKDSKRGSDAISARRLAAIRYIKEAEYHASKSQYSYAFWSYTHASEMYKSVDGENDLGDQDSAEQARIKAIANLDLSMKTGDSMFDSNTLDIMRYQYEYLAKLVIADQGKSEAYKRRGDAHLQALRNYMRTAARNAQKKAARDAAEERSRRERSARDFANAVGAATTMMNSAKSAGAAPAYSSNSQTRQGETASGACTTEACYVALCKKDGGQPAISVSAEGCRKVHCNGLGSRGWMQVISAPKGSGCVSLVKMNLTLNLRRLPRQLKLGDPWGGKSPCSLAGNGHTGPGLALTRPHSPSCPPKVAAVPEAQTYGRTPAGIAAP